MQRLSFVPFLRRECSVELERLPMKIVRERTKRSADAEGRRYLLLIQKKKRVGLMPSIETKITTTVTLVKPDNVALRGKWPQGPKKSGESANDLGKLRLLQEPSQEAKSELVAECQPSVQGSEERVLRVTGGSKTLA